MHAREVRDRLPRPVMIYSCLDGLARGDGVAPAVCCIAVGRIHRDEAIVVTLTLIIGVLNVCLGYAVAVALGYGPPTMVPSWQSLFGEKKSVEEQAFEGLVQELAQGPAELMLDDAADEATEVDPYDEPYDDDAVEFLNVSMDNPEFWDLNEKYVETSILKLNIAMMKSGQRCTDLDTRLRQMQGNSDRETIAECLELLREDCESYLAEQTRNAEQFSERISELGELSVLGDEIEMANLEQSAQVETTLNNLQYMDFDSDLEAANKRLLEEINNLRAARHRLRDNQEAAFLAVARYESRIDKIEKQLFIDPLTKLRNRIGLESQLNDWWEQGRNKKRQMSAALFDLDEFGVVNESHGSLLGDRVLYEAAQFLLRSVGKADTVARYAGQRFFVLMLDVGPRQALKTAETARQQVKNISFTRADRAIQLTTCMGLTDVQPGDEYIDVLERLERAVGFAKARGANQGTFFPGDGQGPELTESPSFGTEPLEIPI
jgi:diguanylate cyclase (GGDEF)-like protein